MTATRASLVSWLLAGLVTAGLAASMRTIPVQVTDSLVPLLQAQEAASWRDAVRAAADSAGYLRPLRIAQIQWLHDVADGEYFLVYKMFHLLLVGIVMALFTAAARVRQAADLCAFAFGLTVLTGLHTFLGTVWEAYPINHFLEIVAACLGAWVLAESRGGWWADGALILLFAVAVLTLESGLLVWVVAVAAQVTGARGVSRRGLVVLTALLAGYLVLRFGYFDTGLPTLVERSTGVGVARLDPAELTRRFGDRPLVLYAYNVASSLGSVLASQPRAGVWTLLAEHGEGGVAPGTLLNLGVSVATTAGVALWTLPQAARVRPATLRPSARIAVVAGAVLVANAVLSYGYTKDEIMSPAGAFYALAAYAVAREWLVGPRPAAGAAAVGWREPAALLLVLGVATGWSIRALGVHYHLHQMAHEVRNEWVTVDSWLVRQQAAPESDAGRRLVRQLREDALARVTGHPWGLALQGTRVFR